MKAKRTDCSGCHNDFYNRNRMGLNEPDGPTGQPQCWNLKSAEMVKAKDVPVHMPPPYKSLPMIARPSCYKARGYVRVKPESLTADGYWR